MKKLFSWISHKSHTALKFCQENQKLVLGIVGIVFFAFLMTLGQSKWFKASLLETSNPPNGAIYPIEKSLNYLILKNNENYENYENIDSKYFADLPDYELIFDKTDNPNDNIKLAKKTY
ncbi:MAG TPA: hypothetical protein PLQ36_03715, partial [Candidatus Gracilibacteria bacterium]|nr:hypothetical protein [Candidatus Gracilibacteria bacterium]